MCLAIPMKIIKKLDDERSIAELEGVKREILTTLIPDLRVGDYVIVHAGFALNKVDFKEAEVIINLVKKADI
ncbi:MAG: HypC/HybG/HupF family hydrogenase formation chaperone [Spirochaetes bacterium]|nr:HypC/HybG/HupF family hydrogenase formation chaperone [Spirochaetota bacterium]